MADSDQENNRMAAQSRMIGIRLALTDLVQVQSLLIDVVGTVSRDFGMLTTGLCGEVSNDVAGEFMRTVQEMKGLAQQLKQVVGWVHKPEEESEQQQPPPRPRQNLVQRQRVHNIVRRGSPATISRPSTSPNALEMTVESVGPETHDTSRVDPGNVEIKEEPADYDLVESVDYTLVKTEPEEDEETTHNPNQGGDDEDDDYVLRSGDYTAKSSLKRVPRQEKLYDDKRPRMDDVDQQASLTDDKTSLNLPLLSGDVEDTRQNKEFSNPMTYSLMKDTSLSMGDADNTLPGQLKLRPNVAFYLQTLNDFVKNSSPPDDKPTVDEPQIHLQCHICGQKFYTTESLKEHTKVHCSEKNVKCSVCDRSFRNQGHLDLHFRTHTDQRQYSCLTCGKQFLYQNGASAHLRKVHPEADYHCNSCNMTITGNDMPAHMEFHRKTRYPCDECNKCFRKGNDLLRHKASHTGEKPFKCDICGKSYGIKPHLVQHIRLHNGEKPFECEICGKSFGLKLSLHLHTKRNHCSERSFICEICGKGFIAQCELDRHFRIHTGEKPFLCSICGAAYRLSSGLGSHMKRRHGVTRKSVACETCGKTFEYNHLLKKHVKAKHPELLDDKSKPAPIQSTSKSTEDDSHDIVDSMGSTMFVSEAQGYPDGPVLVCNEETQHTNLLEIENENSCETND